MPYNPNIHHRRSIRLKGYDYSQAGAYFITVCCNNSICRFGDVIENKMILNEYGIIAYNEWLILSERFSNFKLDVFQIMPNHTHCIIILNPVRATLAVAPDNQAHIDNHAHIDDHVALDNQAHIDNQAAPDNQADADGTIDQNNGADGMGADGMGARAGASPAPTLVGDIVGAYKSLVANGCLDIYKSKNEIMGKLWQRNYYEHIIRNEQAYQNISNYIINNPANWNADKFYLRTDPASIH